MEGELTKREGGHRAGKFLVLSISLPPFAESTRYCPLPPTPRPPKTTLVSEEVQ